MPKAAIILLAGADTHADRGRALNALETVEQFQAAGDEAKLIFDGAGVEWIPLLTDEGHDFHEKFLGVQASVHGACQFCANAYGVRKEVEATDVPLLDERNRHPDLHALIADGYHVVTF